MLSPNRTKFKKQRKGRLRGKARRGNTLSFGSFGLQAVETGMLSARQIEAARRTLARSIRRRGKIWISVFPDKPITQRPAEVRMGGGKGPVDHWAARVKAGRVLYEMDGVDEAGALIALRLASYKLPMRTQVIRRAP